MCVGLYLKNRFYYFSVTYTLYEHALSMFHTHHFDAPFTTFRRFIMTPSSVDFTNPIACLAAVTQDGWALGDVPKELRTPELCLAAVTQEGWALASVLQRCV